MSITDELRKFIEKRVWKDDYRRDNLLAIADRIDAEHESACAEAYGNGVMSVPIALDESAWVELPKDADGVPIRVGDKLRFDNGIIVEVRYLKIDSEGTSVCVLATNGGGDFYAITDKAHHYYALTVEDVLMEFALACEDAGNAGPEVARIAAEYAKRLRLVGDAE